MRYNMQIFLIVRCIYRPRPPGEDWGGVDALDKKYTSYQTFFFFECVYVSLPENPIAIGTKQRLNHFALKYTLVLKANPISWKEHHTMKTLPV